MNTLSDSTITILQLNMRLSDAIANAPGVRNVWVVGETSDVRTSNGHCYLELVEKDVDGSNRSRIRANIWANVYRSLCSRFKTFTGNDFGSGIKIRACVTASYHPAYGMSVTISDIDPAYTAGDAMRRRAEILQRLASEGLTELNRQLSWPLVPYRIAVVSAHGAAGYGDFITHLFTHPSCLRFEVSLFSAVMQGDRTVPTILEALERISASRESFDAVVIIRGGGATTDLAAFDSYELARAIATFPLPVVLGIGHERDITVLDYVANVRVKTPTAAAEVLIGRTERVLEALGRAADKIYQAASRHIATQREHLASVSASLPGIVTGQMMRNMADLERKALSISTCVLTTLTARGERLDRQAADIAAASNRNLERNRERLDRFSELLVVLSPQAILARGFSLTMLKDGSVVRDASLVKAGTVLTTTFARGSITSVAEGNADPDNTGI